MKTIYKYSFEIEDSFSLILPYGFEILKVDIQNSVPCFWALIDDKNEVVNVDFKIFGTGFSIKDDNLKYSGTIYQGPYVWHLFSVIS